MLLAAVDLGSNSFRLEIGRVEGAQILRQNYWKETIRLAAGLDDHKRLARKSIETACECLARMNERLRGMPGEVVRAVGTETLRTAVNVDEFLLEAQHALGFPIEVISGREEARLIFEGCMHTLPPSDKRRLVVDVGGASTEVIVGRGFIADNAESFRVGCVSLSLRFFRNGQIDRNAFRQAVVAASAEVEEAIDVFARRNWDEAFGSSGTVDAVSDILRTEGWTDGTITFDGLQKLRQALLVAGDTRRIKLTGMKPDRQQVIPGGTAVLVAIFETLGVTEMRPAKGALRVGVLYDLLGRRESRDLRDASVDRLQERFAVDRVQAQRVEKVASRVFGALQPNAPESDAKLLAWACALHELGFAISHSDYHKHGAYLVAHADVAGFSKSDQERLAELVLGQRGNLKKIADALADPVRAAKVLALRLAVIFCHARHDVDLPRLNFERTRNAIALSIDRNWLAEHPLTQHLLEEEASQWDRAGARLHLRPL
jgi:exopolyphosphatase/guanosine-5'-triphosphate,3'-diphosphate pyrophosphatase